MTKNDNDRIKENDREQERINSQEKKIKQEKIGDVGGMVCKVQGKREKER